MGTATAQVQGRRSVWWAVGYAAALGGAAVAATVGVLRPLDPGLTALTVALALSAVCLRWVDRQVVRQLSATVDGLVVESPRLRRAVRWDEVRRVRTQGGLGMPHLDTALDLRDGTLVPLPRGTPGGTVESWREGLGGGDAPPAELPQTWQIPGPDLGWPYALTTFGGNMAIQALVSTFRPSLAGAMAMGLGFLLVVVVGYRHLPQLGPQQVSADVSGVRFGRRGRRHVPWSDVVEVRPLSRFEPVTVLERTDGDLVQVPGPPPEVVQQWQQLSREP